LPPRPARRACMLRATLRCSSRTIKAVCTANRLLARSSSRFSVPLPDFGSGTTDILPVVRSGRLQAWHFVQVAVERAGLYTGTCVRTFVCGGGRPVPRAIVVFAARRNPTCRSHRRPGCTERARDSHSSGCRRLVWGARLCPRLPQGGHQAHYRLFICRGWAETGPHRRVSRRVPFVITAAPRRSPSVAVGKRHLPLANGDQSFCGRC